MDIATLAGLILAVVAIGAGMTLKGANISILLNPEALLIIFGGTIATICIGFPSGELKKIPQLFKIAFTEQKLMPYKNLLSTITDLANTGRREGLLSLDRKLVNIKDSFLREALMMVIDGRDPEFINTLLNDEVCAMEERHRNGALIFTQAGTYSPTLGVLGAVIGLISALSNLSDTDKLGHAISAAFVATLLGIFMGYVMWHPIANKLKQKSKLEVQLKLTMIEGILGLQEGYSAAELNQKLNALIPPADRRIGRGGT